jgi:hypothetical protein
MNQNRLKLAPCGHATWDRGHLSRSGFAAVLAVPPALAGSAAGLRFYRGFNDRQFSIGVNAMLLLSGVTLAA